MIGSWAQYYECLQENKPTKRILDVHIVGRADMLPIVITI